MQILQQQQQEQNIALVQQQLKQMQFVASARFIELAPIIFQQESLITKT